jgi:serine phosphatase RsbU (regulator of sigma subunit)
MSLRAQLALVFGLLAVLPLTAISVYSYFSSKHAMQQTVRAEGLHLATDMTDRLKTATESITRGIERASELPFVPAASGTAEDVGTERERILEHFRTELGASADFLESFLIVPADPPSPPGAPGPRPVSEADPAPRRRVLDGEIVLVASPTRSSAESEDDESRFIWRHVLAGEELSSEQEEALARTIEHGAAVFAKRLEERVLEAKKEIEEAPDPARKAEEMGRDAVIAARQMLGAFAKHGAQIKMLMERRWDVALTHDGATLGTLRARIRGRKLLDEVFTHTRRDSGEIPFAIDADGKLQVGQETERGQLEALRVLEIAAASPDSQMVRDEGDWVIVTQRDDESGLTLGIVRPIGSSLHDIRSTALRNLTYGLGLACLAFIGIVPLSRRMTQELATLTEGAERLAQGDLGVQVPVRSRDEVGRLATAFNEMATSLKAQRTVVVERERLRKELEMSRSIQQELLPCHPLHVGFAEVSGLSLPAREVGGDFFNYFTLSDGSLAVLIGDVAGKGVPAALLAANLQATLRALLPLESDLATLATRLDEHFEENTPSYAYATLFMAVLHPAERTLRWLNAGHNPQYLLAGDRSMLLSPGGRPLGLLPGGGFEAGEEKLQPGDALFLYTDGLTDAENRAGDYFGVERLEALLDGGRGAAPEAMLTRVEMAVRQFRDGAEANDDATLVMLRLPKV